jgi:hypothetical protein
MGVIFTTQKFYPTKAASLGVLSKDRHKYETDYGWFHFTFLGFDFYDRNTGATLSKSQLFWRNPKAAITMANSLIVPKQYKLKEYKPLKSNRCAA